MCKAQCDPRTQKVLCYGTNQSSVVSIVPQSTKAQSSTYIIRGGGGEDQRESTTVTTSIINGVLVSATSVYVSPGEPTVTLVSRGPAFNFTIGKCQRCPLDSFDVDCQDSPQGYCCIKNQVVEDACRKLEG
jgi:hypothetical protein